MESRKWERGRKLTKRMIENFPNHKKEMTHNIQSTFSRLNIKRSSPGHVIIKLSKVKEFWKQREKSNLSHCCHSPLLHPSPLPIRLIKFLTRNFVIQDKVEWYVPGAKTNKQKMSSKNTVSSKAVLQKWRRGRLSRTNKSWVSSSSPVL